MSAAGSFFVDTNVLLYQLTPADVLKQSAASLWMGFLWQHSSGRISWQVIHEFYSNAVRKLGVPAPVAGTAAERLLLWNPESPGLTNLHRAWHWCDAAQLSYWDALIVAAAEQSGCEWLLSEDFPAGRKFGAITVVNPFLREPREFGLA